MCNSFYLYIITDFIYIYIYILLLHLEFVFVIQFWWVFFFQFIELSASLIVDEFPLSIKAFLIKSIETCAKLQNFNFYLFIQFLTINIVKRDKCPKEWSSKSQFPSYYLFQHIVMFSNLLCECVKQNTVSTLACRHAAVVSCCSRRSPLFIYIGQLSYCKWSVRNKNRDLFKWCGISYFFNSKYMRGVLPPVVYKVVENSKEIDIFFSISLYNDWTRKKPDD